jgi:hypothetical protein
MAAVLAMCKIGILTPARSTRSAKDLTLPVVLKQDPDWLFGHGKMAKHSFQF